MTEWYQNLDYDYLELWYKWLGYSMSNIEIMVMINMDWDLRGIWI